MNGSLLPIKNKAGEPNGYSVTFRSKTRGNHFKYFGAKEYGTLERAKIAAEEYQTNYARYLASTPITPPDGFREIPGHTAYAINEQGRIINLRTGNALKPNNSNGYSRCRLGPKGPTLGIHRCLALAWLPEPSAEKAVVNHIDGNKLNNDISNLEWTTRKENVQHAYDTGLVSKARPRIPYTGDLPQEEWRSLDSCGGIEFKNTYHVSNLGRVRGLRNNILNQGQNPSGYLVLSINTSSGHKTVQVHRLVATAFYGEPPQPDMVVDHKDRSKTNNAASNLEWVTSSENSKRAFGKAIEQRSPEGELVAEFRTIVCAAEATSSPVQCLYRSIQNHTLYNNFYWVRAGETIKAQTANQAEKKVPCRGGPPAIPIQQLTLDGVLVASFRGASAASKELKISNTSIARALKTGAPYRGFLWVRQGADNPEWLTFGQNPPKPRLGAPGLAVEQRSLEGELVAVFPSIRGAAKGAGVPNGGLYRQLNSGKPYRGYLWVRQAPPSTPELD